MARKIPAADEAAIRQGVRHMMNDRLNAWDNLVADIAVHVGAEKAPAIARAWQKTKCMKFDGYRYVVKHGGLWDIEALERAYRYETTGSI